MKSLANPTHFVADLLPSSLSILPEVQREKEQESSYSGAVSPRGVWGVGWPGGTSSTNPFSFVASIY